MSAYVLLLAVVAQSPDVATSTRAPRLEVMLRTDEPEDGGRRLTLVPDLSLRASVGSEWDTNAPRTPTSGDAPAPPGDGVVRVLADLRGSFSVTERDVISARYLVGMKRFFGEETEDLLVHDLDGGASVGLPAGLDVGLRGRYRASRIRSGARDYTLTSVGGSLTWRPLDLLRATAEGRLDTLDFPPACLLSYQGPALRGAVDLYPIDGLELGASGGLAARTYQGRYTGAAIALCSERSDRREDVEPHVGLHGTYRGSFLVGVELSARFGRSNDDNEDIDRYRASAWATVPLVLDVVLSVQGALQFNRGSSVTATLRPEDDENQNSFEIQLARPLLGELDLVARYSVYANEFATAAAAFTRHTVYGGLSYETGP